MSLPPKLVLQHLGLEPLPLALLADGGDAGHHRQVGVDDAGAVAVGAGALGVGAEQRRLHAVGLRERLADRVEQSGVRRRVAPPRAADRAPGRPTPRRPGPTPSRGSASSCPTRPRRSPPPARRAGCRRRRPAGCACWRRGRSPEPVSSAQETGREIQSSPRTPQITEDRHSQRAATTTTPGSRVHPALPPPSSPRGMSCFRRRSARNSPAGRVLPSLISSWPRRIPSAASAKSWPSHSK